MCVLTVVQEVRFHFGLASCKLLGLRRGKPPSEDTTIESLRLKSSQKIGVVGVSCADARVVAADKGLVESIQQNQQDISSFLSIREKQERFLDTLLEHLGKGLSHFVSPQTRLRYGLLSGERVFVVQALSLLAEPAYEHGYGLAPHTVSLAALSGDPKMLQLLRTARYDLHFDNDSAFVDTCLFGFLPTIEFLFENGASLDARGPLLWSSHSFLVNHCTVRPIAAACHGGHENAVKWLQARGARIDAEALRMACLGGRRSLIVKCVAALLEKTRLPSQEDIKETVRIKERDLWGVVLHWSSQGENVSLLSWLLQRADINFADVDLLNYFEAETSELNLPNRMDCAMSVLNRVLFWQDSLEGIRLVLEAGGIWDENCFTLACRKGLEEVVWQFLRDRAMHAWSESANPVDAAVSPARVAALDTPTKQFLKNTLIRHEKVEMLAERLVNEQLASPLVSFSLPVDLARIVTAYVFGTEGRSLNKISMQRFHLVRCMEGTR